MVKHHQVGDRGTVRGQQRGRGAACAEHVARQPGELRSRGPHRSRLWHASVLVLGLCLALSRPASSAEIHDAARKGDLTRVTQILASDPRAATARDKQGFTALHWAAAKGNVKLAALLLSKGADPGAKGSLDVTPLHWAASNGALDVVSLLLSKKAPASAPTKRGVTPLHLAAANHRLKVAEELIVHGAQVNAVTADGMTPLADAKLEGDKEMVALLRKHGGHP